MPRWMPPAERADRATLATDLTKFLPAALHSIVADYWWEPPLQLTWIRTFDQDSYGMSGRAAIDYELRDFLLGDLRDLVAEYWRNVSLPWRLPPTGPGIHTYIFNLYPGNARLSGDTNFTRVEWY